MATVTSLIIVWAIAVVAFFVLWAILLKVVRRISEKKEQRKKDLEKNPNNPEY
jgi:flagellar biosynthesis/type III secretory pathway M-ring protein FliF/YscJ